MQDFTFDKYLLLIESFAKAGYSTCSVDQYVSTKSNVGKTLILRHDVDRYPNNTLKMAKLEYEAGKKGTYYFRIIPSVYKEDIIKQVCELGHEVAYHYEDLSLCKGNYEKAIKHFEEGLNKIRKFAPARTICMHGSPMSKWDNKKLWEKYNYKDYGIVADTSLDINYNEIFYITDNGWGWNNTAASIRDKVESVFDIPINNTDHLIDLVKAGKLPNKVMINAHPDTFFDQGIRWYANKAMIKSKNIVKRIIVKYKILT